jgi:hypothetical protein
MQNIEKYTLTKLSSNISTKYMQNLKIYCYALYIPFPTASDPLMIFNFRQIVVNKLQRNK